MKKGPLISSALAGIALWGCVWAKQIDTQDTSSISSISQTSDTLNNNNSWIITQTWDKVKQEVEACMNTRWLKLKNIFNAEETSYIDYIDENWKLCRSYNTNDIIPVTDKPYKPSITRNAQIWAIARSWASWLSLSADSYYIEATTNADDKYGLGLAYKNSWFVVWASASRAREGKQYGLWVWYVWDINDDFYLWTALKHTRFNANNWYADAKSNWAMAFVWYNLNSNLSFDLWARYSKTNIDWYSSFDSLSPYVWVNYSANNGTKFSLSGHKDWFSASVSWPIDWFSGNNPDAVLVDAGDSVEASSGWSWNENKNNKANTDLIASFVADSGFSSSMVKKEVVPVVAQEQNQDDANDNAQDNQNNDNGDAQNNNNQNEQNNNQNNAPLPTITFGPDTTVDDRSAADVWGDTSIDVTYTNVQPWAEFSISGHPDFSIDSNGVIKYTWDTDWGNVILTVWVKNPWQTQVTENVSVTMFNNG